MRIGIVGAGICGLAAARTLHQLGHQAVVFEKSRAPGGRVWTYRKGEYVWDSGATSIAPRGKRIQDVLLKELSTEGLVPIQKPIYVHTGLRISPGHPNGAPRYTYFKGNAELPLRLAEGLDIRLDSSVDSIERVGTGYKILEEEFDGLILTAPVPQTTLLLWSLGESRPMANVKYRPCLSIMLGFDAELPPTNYHAILDTDQVHPMTWLCLESVKSQGRAPAGGSTMVAQMSAGYSHNYYEREDEALVRAATGYVERLYGDKFQSPTVSKVKRWKYSQPESFASYEHVNPKGSRLLIASDGILGGHVEDAYEVGTLTARQIVEVD